MKINLMIVTALAAVIGLSNCKPKTTTSTTTAPANSNSAADVTRADITNITNREISAWEFAKTKQLDKLDNLLADDYTAFFGKVVMSKADVIRNFQASTINNYRLYNIKVKKVADNAAIIHYEALQNARDAEGDQWMPVVAVSTVYMKRGNAWHPVFYHETPMINQ
jgi:hypothetical protein